MSALNSRLPARPRVPLRSKANTDENATSKHARSSSSTSVTAGLRATALKTISSLHRPALGEKAISSRSDLKGKRDADEKNGSEPEQKRRLLAIKTGPQREAVPNSARKKSTTQRLLAHQRRASPASARKVVSNQKKTHVYIAVDDYEVASSDYGMELEGIPLTDPMEPLSEYGNSPLKVDSDDPIPEEELLLVAGSDATEVPDEPVIYEWPDVPSTVKRKAREELDEVRAVFEDHPDLTDLTMLAEYSEEIFAYMAELETSMTPGSCYMAGQNEITWPMREELVDWLIQIHVRYHLLPETLWIAINIIDRFLTKRIVSTVKLQLVGISAMFIAAKYEEITCPSIDEFLFVSENGFRKEEIIKGERIMLTTLEFKISQYCSPYSWMRKISKADDYDIQTRTLSKFLTEVTLLDHRFVSVKPSQIAAVGMYTARRMLGGGWDSGFVFYSGYTEAELATGHCYLLQKLREEAFVRTYLCKKYATKKFLKSAVYAIDWARENEL